MDAAPTNAQNRGMRAFWFDGFFAWFSEWIVLQYLILYALAYGASDVQIGYLSAAVSLAMAASLFPGARLAEVWGRRKTIVMLTGGGAARIVLIGLVIAPFFSDGKEMVYIITALGAARVFFSGLGLPAWTSFAADLVPLSVRGRFFSSRNFGMGVAALISAPLAGLMIDRMSFPEGWQAVWLVALVTGFLASACYWRIPEREIERSIKSIPVAPESSSGVLRDSNFLGFCAVTFMWNLALYIAAPFFNVHLIRGLGGNEAWVGGLLAVNSISSLVGQVFAGRLLDERGAKWLMAITGLAIPFLPIGWVFVTEPWHIIIINGVGGALWAGYNLAWFNLLLYISPANKRAFYSAVNQAMIYTSAFVGPLIGGVVGQAYGLRWLFAISGIGRLVAAIAFLPLVKERPAGAPISEDVEA